MNFVRSFWGFQAPRENVNRGLRRGWNQVRVDTSGVNLSTEIPFTREGVVGHCVYVLFFLEEKNEHVLVKGEIKEYLKEEKKHFVHFFDDDSEDTLALENEEMVAWKCKDASGPIFTGEGSHWRADGENATDASTLQLDQEANKADVAHEKTGGDAVPRGSRGRTSRLRKHKDLRGARDIETKVESPEMDQPLTKLKQLDYVAEHSEARVDEKPKEASAFQAPTGSGTELKRDAQAIKSLVPEPPTEAAEETNRTMVVTAKDDAGAEKKPEAVPSGVVETSQQKSGVGGRRATEEGESSKAKNGEEVVLPDRKRSQPQPVSQQRTKEVMSPERTKAPKRELERIEEDAREEGGRLQSSSEAKRRKPSPSYLKSPTADRMEQAKGGEGEDTSYKAKMERTSRHISLQKTSDVDQSRLLKAADRMSSALSMLLDASKVIRSEVESLKKQTAVATDGHSLKSILHRSDWQSVKRSRSKLTENAALKRFFDRPDASVEDFLQVIFEPIDRLGKLEKSWNSLISSTSTHIVDAPFLNAWNAWKVESAQAKTMKRDEMQQPPQDGGEGKANQVPVDAEKARVLSTKGADIPIFFETTGNRTRDDVIQMLAQALAVPQPPFEAAMRIENALHRLHGQASSYKKDQMAKSVSSSGIGVDRKYLEKSYMLWKVLSPKVRNPLLVLLRYLSGGLLLRTFQIQWICSMADTHTKKTMR